ncbi:MAG: S1 RNA-binding domain-containing protein [Deltaproteobacteria bacterium]|nr:S1 RNA-binding domain-containing protein [Deltaproteobacteria bacterium]
MRLLEYIQKSNSVDRKVVSSPHFDKLLNYLEAGISLAELAENQIDLLKSIPGPQLKRLSDARRTWLELEAEKEDLIQEFKKKEIIVGDSLFKMTLTLRRMEALRHIVPVIAPSKYSGEESWLDAIGAILEVWTGALNLTLKKGEILVTEESGKIDTDYSDIIGKKMTLSSIDGEIWARIRRAMMNFSIDISYEYSISSISSHLQAVMPRLGSVASEYELTELLNMMVLDHLPKALSNNFDNKLRDELLKEFGTQYVDILRTPPIKVPKMGAFFPNENGTSAAVSVISDKGRVVASEIVSLENEWHDTVRIFFVKNKTSYIAVPVMDEDHGTVDVLREKVGNFLVFIPVGTYGFSDSTLLQEKSFENLQEDVSYSVILARRLLFPSREFSHVDPLELLNLQGDGDEESIRTYLLEQKGLALMDPSIDKIPPRVLSQSPASLIAIGAKLNPDVKGIDDVKVGMELTGVIINITKFGAFVNIGLSQEALIHVSEMADDFVNDPFDIVTLGQQVKVTVVAVDMDKNRISLSLRSSPRFFEGKPIRRNYDDRRPRSKDEKYQSPSARSQALKDLENLFKK